jgi:hypothetical protein
VFRRTGGFGVLVGLLLIGGAGAEQPQVQAETQVQAVRQAQAVTLVEALAPGSQAGAVVPPSTSPGSRAPQDFGFGALLKTHPLAAATGGLVLGLLVVLPLADRWVLWKRPRWLLRLPDRGLLLPYAWDFDAQSPKVLPLGSQLFGFLKHRPRVLDAWVADHLATIEQRFSDLATVEQRRHHLGLPVKVGQRLEAELTPERLKALGAVGGLVLISGEGGVGKTSLALEMARLALAGELTGRPAVPVLVEADLRGEESLLSRVRSTLAGLCEHRGTEGGTPPPSLPLVRALLERRRLLVILDHFSELADESRRRLSPTADDFPSGWVIVTSRREEDFSGKGVLRLRPQRLTADRLHRFFVDYLARIGKEESLDFDLHQRAVARLDQITAGLVDERRAITVLLAKLYIDVVLTERRGAGGGGVAGLGAGADAHLCAPDQCGDPGA